MKKKFLATLLCAISMLSCNREALLHPADDLTEELAYRFAPVHYQDTHSDNVMADYITRFDYDGNWKSTDNWEHLASYNLSAYVYYSVVETNTHWFILYGFFHPRDWTNEAFTQEHENDMEGILTIVKKDSSRFGTLQGLITVAHDHFYSFVPRGSTLTNGNEDIDGELSFYTLDGQPHPKTCQESMGHGIKAWPYAGNFSSRSGEQGIIYFPSQTSTEVPGSGNDRHVNYKLINLTGFGNLWTEQLIEARMPYDQSKIFAKWGTLKGDQGGGCGNGLSIGCPTDKAHTPWCWNDEDDRRDYAGELALDPAALVDDYFNGLGSFDHKYLSNKYLKDLQVMGFNDGLTPYGWPSRLMLSDLYRKLR